MLCAILRISVILQQNESVNLQELEVFRSHEGFKLVCYVIVSFYLYFLKNNTNTQIFSCSNPQSQCPWMFSSLLCKTLVNIVGISIDKYDQT